MEKIASFTVNHILLNPGIYVSRVDKVNDEYITTYDLRYLKPNNGLYLSTKAMHTIEHLGATFLRNHPIYKDKVIYFGPMGCRTGFYIILSLDVSSKDIVHLVKEMNDFVLDFVGEIPGASPKDCGNYKDMSLEGAKKFAKKYNDEFLSNPKDEQLNYPN